MVNHVLLIGKIKKLPSLALDNRYCMTLEVIENFRTRNGVLGSFEIEIFLWKGVAESILQGQKVNSLVSVKGRLSKEGQHLTVFGETIFELDQYLSHIKKEAL